MTFQQLHLAVEVARLGSINKAASELFIAQSNISTLLKDLELELNINIFKRSNRGVTLTERGREFLSYIQPIVAQMEKIEDIYKGTLPSPIARFSVTTQRYPFVDQAFIEFLSITNQDRFEYKMKETNMYQVIDDVCQNRADLGIIFLSDITENFIKKVLSVKKLEFFKIVEVVPHVYLSKNHPLAKKKVIFIDELSEYPYLVFGQDVDSTMDFAEEVSVLDFKSIKKVIYVYDRASFYNLSAHTDAFSIGSGIIPKGFGDSTIITVPIGNHQEKMKIGWIKLKDATMTSYMELFVSCLEQSL